MLECSMAEEQQRVRSLFELDNHLRVFGCPRQAKLKNLRGLSSRHLQVAVRLGHLVDEETQQQVRWLDLVFAIQLVEAASRLTDWEVHWGHGLMVGQLSAKIESRAPR